MGWTLVEKLEGVIKLHNWWNNVPRVKRGLCKDTSPVRIGVLGAASINWIAIFDPVETHPSAVISAVAARSLEKAKRQIDKYNLDAKAYGSYAELLEDPNIDAVYIPLPNGLHCEWAVRVLEAGKHVLIEKPIAANRQEAEKIQEASLRTKKVAVEAFHWRFHPATHMVKDIVESGKYGNVQQVEAKIYVPGGEIADDDIRFSYSLAGGASMDLTYGFSSTSYFASPSMSESDYEVIEAEARTNKIDERIDDAMVAQYAVTYPGKPKVTCTVSVDLNGSKILGGLVPDFKRMTPIVIIHLEKARIEFANFPLSFLSHSITISDKDVNGNMTGTSRKRKCFKNGPSWDTRGEEWWSTYRYQLEAFIDRVKAEPADGTPQMPWVSLDDSIKLMGLIDAVYEKAGLLKRGM